MTIMAGQQRTRAEVRRQVTDAKINAAVLDIVRSSGPRAVTVEAVAARSGVAKTSIYRRYRDRHDMLRGVARHMSRPPAIGAYPASREGLIAWLRDVQTVFEGYGGLQSAGQVFASGDADLQWWRDEVAMPRLRAIKDFFAHGVETGQMSPDVDYDLVIELITGGMIVCDAIRGDVPDSWADDVVHLLWPLIERAPAPGPGGAEPTG